MATELIVGDHVEVKIDDEWRLGYVTMHTAFVGTAQAQISGHGTVKLPPHREGQMWRKVLKESDA